jgi:hypothetical protein
MRRLERQVEDPFNFCLDAGRTTTPLSGASCSERISARRVSAAGGVGSTLREPRFRDHAAAVRVTRVAIPVAINWLFRSSTDRNSGSSLDDDRPPTGRSPERGRPDNVK